MKTHLIMGIDGTIVINDHSHIPQNGFDGEWIDAEFSRLDHPDLFKWIEKDWLEMNRVLPSDARFRVRMNTDVRDEIIDITNRDDVNPIWLTLWEHNATELFAPFSGIGENWTVIENDSNSTNWKIDEATRISIANPNDQVIIIDDLLNDNDEKKDSLIDATDSCRNLFAIIPESTIALTATEIKWIKNAIDSPMLINGVAGNGWSI